MSEDVFENSYFRDTTKCRHSTPEIEFL